jgi:hypothetical protein
LAVKWYKRHLLSVCDKQSRPSRLRFDPAAGHLGKAHLLQSPTGQPPGRLGSVDPPGKMFNRRCASGGSLDVGCRRFLGPLFLSQTVTVSDLTSASTTQLLTDQLAVKWYKRHLLSVCDMEHEDEAVNQAELEVREGRERRREGLGSTPRCCGGGRLTSQLRG